MPFLKLQAKKNEKRKKQKEKNINWVKWVFKQGKKEKTFCMLLYHALF